MHAPVECPASSAHFNKIHDEMQVGFVGRLLFDVSFFVFQSPLLEHAEMRVFPRGLCDLSFREAEIQGGEMTT
jgi:lipid-A-disaccharide synthase-like uncharacterized protein